MTSENKITVDLIHGIPESMRATAARLYEDAFGSKFAVAIPAGENRTALLEDSLNLAYAFGAVADNELVGLAGYKTADGSLTDRMDYQLLTKHAGLWRGTWAALVFGFYERSLQPDQLLMDGIVVGSALRGQGVGTCLLDKLARFAKAEGFRSVRLDVIDTNPHARRMYERNGFRATRTEKFGYLRWFFGFGASTTLERDV